MHTSSPSLVLSVAAIAAVVGLAGCSSTQSGNKAAVFAPQVTDNTNKANIQIREVVRGRGCNGQFLKVFSSGDKNFLGLADIDMASDEGKAKAAAAYNALYGGQDKELNTDIIVNPVFQIEKTGFFLASQVCASVVGYRGVITSWESQK